MSYTGIYGDGQDTATMQRGLEGSGGPVLTGRPQSSGLRASSYTDANFSTISLSLQGRRFARRR